MNCSKQNKTKHHISVYVKLPVPTDEPQSTLARFGGTFVGRQKQENCEFEVSMSYKIKQNSSPTKTKQNKSRYLSRLCSSESVAGRGDCRLLAVTEVIISSLAFSLKADSKDVASCKLTS